MFWLTVMYRFTVMLEFCGCWNSWNVFTDSMYSSNFIIRNKCIAMNDAMNVLTWLHQSPLMQSLTHSLIPSIHCLSKHVGYSPYSCELYLQNNMTSYKCSTFLMLVSYKWTSDNADIPSNYTYIIHWGLNITPSANGIW